MSFFLFPFQELSSRFIVTRAQPLCLMTPPKNVSYVDVKHQRCASVKESSNIPQRLIANM